MPLASSSSAVPASGLILEHIRLVRGPDYVEGELRVDGARWCYLLEDQWRDLLGRFGKLEPKVPARTCIPAGEYRIRNSMSPRFGKVTVEILDIPGFAGVRYHAGSGVEHSAGCPLLGHARAGKGRILGDPALTDKLVQLLDSRKGTHHVRITDAFFDA